MDQDTSEDLRCKAFSANGDTPGPLPQPARNCTSDRVIARPWRTMWGLQARAPRLFPSAIFVPRSNKDTNEQVAPNIASTRNVGALLFSQLDVDLPKKANRHNNNGCFFSSSSK